LFRSETVPRKGVLEVFEADRGVEIRPSGIVLAPVAPASDDEYEELELNTEAFERGGSSWSPPTQEGIYDAVCGGLMVPAFAVDQAWFGFSSEVSIGVSLGVIAVTLALTTVASLIKSRKDDATADV